ARGQDPDARGEAPEPWLEARPRHRRRGGRPELRAGGAEHRRDRRPAEPGRQCLRHPAAGHARPDPGCRGSAGGAAEMKAELYDVIRRPVITEKATMASEHGAVVFEVDIAATKPVIREAIESLFKVKVKAINTVVTKGKTKRFRGRPGRRKDVKKAYVTLVEGNTIDVTTGL